VVAGARSTLNTGNGEDAPGLWAKTHLAFGDAQTVAMVDRAGGPDKERRHFTGQKCPLLAPKLSITGH
jgi:hypothetical protein